LPAAASIWWTLRPSAAVERCGPIFAALSERILRAGTAGSGQAAVALADFLHGVELLAASEVLRIGQRFGLEAGMLLDIGEGSAPSVPRWAACCGGRSSPGNSTAGWLSVTY
jgi:3-hydroxyisobutyrate dehydrogenase-like beta-hydroxyacid dehydrogenase